MIFCLIKFKYILIQTPFLNLTICLDFGDDITTYKCLNKNGSHDKRKNCVFTVKYKYRLPVIVKIFSYNVQFFGNHNKFLLNTNIYMK